MTFQILFQRLCSPLSTVRRVSPTLMAGKFCVPRPTPPRVLYKEKKSNLNIKHYHPAHQETQVGKDTNSLNISTGAEFCDQRGILSAVTSNTRCVLRAVGFNPPPGCLFMRSTPCPLKRRWLPLSLVVFPRISVRPRRLYNLAKNIHPYCAYGITLMKH